MKRRATRSNTRFSMSVKFCGATPVGMMAWWSVTLLLSKTFLRFSSFAPRSGMSSVPYWPEMPFRMGPHLG